MNPGAASINYASGDNDAIGIVQNPLFLETDPVDSAATAAAKDKQSEVCISHAVCNSNIIILVNLHTRVRGQIEPYMFLLRGQGFVGGLHSKWL